MAHAAVPGGDYWFILPTLTKKHTVKMQLPRMRASGARLFSGSQVLEPGYPGVRLDQGDPFWHALQVRIHLALPDHFVPGVFEHKIWLSILCRAGLEVPVPACNVAH